MINLIQFKLNLHRLFKEQDTIREKYSADIKQARLANNHELIDSLRAKEISEDRMIQDRIDSIITRFWVRRAERKSVPIPKRVEGEMWKKSNFEGILHLTDNGVSFVRAGVREETKYIVEVCAVFIAGLTGLLGAATGLLAIWKG